MRALLFVAAAACGSHAHHTTAPDPPPPDPATLGATALDPTASLTLLSEDVTFTAGTNTVPGTLVRPAETGRYPGIVLIAGSGPTDRDWNSPLIATKNGSGKLLAEALAKHGAVVLRFDKAATAANETPMASVTLDTYRDEARAALALLRVRQDVDPAHLFIAGHSEGGIHATRTALVEGPAIAGLVLLSAAGRPMKDIVLAQVAAQLRSALPEKADAELASLRRTLDEFVAGKDVDPKAASTIPPLQQLVATLVAPKTAALGRPLLGLDPAAIVAAVTVPVFVYNGKKDIQIDPELDAGRLVNALKTAKRTVTLFIAEDADHVLKHEPKSITELRANLAAVQRDYNAPDRGLDDATVAALIDWLANHSKRG